MNVNLEKGPGDYSIYGGSAFLALWYACLIGSFIWTCRNRLRVKETRFRSMLYGLPVFAIFGLVAVWAQSRAIVDYVATCRELLAF